MGPVVSLPCYHSDVLSGVIYTDNSAAGRGQRAWTVGYQSKSQGTRYRLGLIVYDIAAVKISQRYRNIALLIRALASFSRTVLNLTHWSCTVIWQIRLEIGRISSKCCRLRSCRAKIQYIPTAECSTNSAVLSVYVHCCMIQMLMTMRGSQKQQLSSRCPSVNSQPTFHPPEPWLRHLRRPVSTRQTHLPANTQTHTQNVTCTYIH